MVHHFYGIHIVPLSGIPVIAAVWLFGIRIGMVYALLFATVGNTVLFNLTDIKGWDALITSNGIPGLIALLFVAAITGYLRELRIKMGHELVLRKQAEENLSRSKLALEQLIATAPAGIFSIDENLCITSWNNMAEKITGMPEMEVMGKKCTDIWLCPTCLKGCGLFSNDVPKPVFAKQCPITLHNGAQIIIEKNIDLLLDSDNNVIGGIEMFLDITERIRMQDKIKKTNENLARKNQEILDFTNMVSHDLKNPLAGLTSTLECIADSGFLNDDADMKEMIDYSLITAEYMGDLLTDLMDVAQLDSGVKQIQKEDIGITDLIKTVEYQLNQLIKKEQIDFSYDLPDIRVYADRRALTKIFMNLIGNAINYMDMGTNEQRSINVLAANENGNYHFMVSDTGMGIPSSLHTEIFIKFKRGTNDDRKGTGLGLAIVKGFVEMHEGEIWVESEVGKGSTFHFTLPIMKREPALDVSS